MKSGGFIAILGLALLGCRGDIARFAFETRNPDGLWISIAARTTEFFVGDTVSFWVFLVNDGPPRTFDNHPRNFGLTVYSERGQLSPRYLRSVDDAVAGTTVFTLPSESSIGRLVNLNCVSVLYGDEPASCLYGYTLEAPGQYRIEVGYAVPRVGVVPTAPDYRLEAFDYELFGDTVVIDVKP